jgi:hypothetical protein
MVTIEPQLPFEFIPTRLCVLASCSERYDEQDLEVFIGVINQELQTIDMEFRKSHDECSGEAVRALV